MTPPSVWPDAYKDYYGPGIRILDSTGAEQIPRAIGLMFPPGTVFEDLGDGTIRIDVGAGLEWKADATYPVDSVVIHGGSLWQAAVENINSEPVAGNTDWTAVLGVEFVTPTIGQVLSDGGPDAGQQVIENHGDAVDDGDVPNFGQVKALPAKLAITQDGEPVEQAVQFLDVKAPARVTKLGDLAVQITSGTVVWNGDDTFPVGQIVFWHEGTWLAAAENQNSEPVSGNPDWSLIGGTPYVDLVLDHSQIKTLTASALLVPSAGPGKIVLPAGGSLSSRIVASYTGISASATLLIESGALGTALLDLHEDDGTWVSDFFANPGGNQLTLWTPPASPSIGSHLLPSWIAAADDLADKGLYLRLANAPNSDLLDGDPANTFSGRLFYTILDLTDTGRAGAHIGGGGDGTVAIAVDALGTGGNDYTVEVVVAGSINAPLSASLTDTAILVTLGTDGLGDPDDAKNTAALVAAAIDGLAGITAEASGTGADPLNSAEGPTPFTGGI